MACIVWCTYIFTYACTHYPRMVLLSILRIPAPTPCTKPGRWRSCAAGNGHRPCDNLVSKWYQMAVGHGAINKKTPPHLWQVSVQKLRWQLVRVKFFVWRGRSSQHTQKNSVSINHRLECPSHDSYAKAKTTSDGRKCWKKRPWHGIYGHAMLWWTFEGP